MKKIPKYKRDEFTFVSNLSQYTANDKYPNTYQRDAYLLSEHYTNARTVDLARKVKKRRNLLISDNGNYSRMKAVAKQYEQGGLLLLRQAKKEQQQYGQLSNETRLARQQLMREIAQSCQKQVEETNYKKVIQDQLLIRPDYLIGMEDLTIPVLMLCHLMHPIFQPQALAILDYQNNTFQYVKDQQSGRYGSKQGLETVNNFTVLHAYDYDSAYQAGKNALNLAKDGLAISYGGPMHSRRWIDCLRIGGNKIQLSEKLPEAYLIAQTITQGAINGHPTNIPFHILGVGTPILIALIGYQLRHSKAISIDSTAPFKDAFIGKLYGYKNAYLKMDMFKLVAYCLIQDVPFEDKSPFYQSFAQKYEHDWKGLRDKLGVRPNNTVKELASKLRERGDWLQDYLPFFTPITGTLEAAFLQDLRIARAGYNYWVLKQICRKVRAKRSDENAFKRWIERQIDQYTKTASSKWAKAVNFAYLLTEGHRMV
ncbi:hypothetical protein [Aureispira anguillae]|uniref:Uncharacterized protein n=1 Tax=Aureispira anguillae TaxID=2864201 RepID=A0A916DQB4_9BACT|nr:hypothetical protein [Aureispira anguillae]BDS10626.1 hypothetical protein AsAng_0013350 [Aureispira anguillae]